MVCSRNYKHLQNEEQYACRSIQKRVIAQFFEMKGECAKKPKHMKVIFHLLEMERPIIEYEAIKSLFGILSVEKLAQRPGDDNSGWRMAHHMHL